MSPMAELDALEENVIVVLDVHFLDNYVFAESQKMFKLS